MADELHHPMAHAGRAGAWYTCRCGWQSPIFPAITDAAAAYAEHVS